MGKRSNFKRRERDFYPTPWEAVKPLVRHLPPRLNNVWEPCAGKGDLIGVIDYYRPGGNWLATDIEPQAPFLLNCTDIVSVGRVKWIPDSKMTGKDNCCWYRFHLTGDVVTTRFWPRVI